MVVRQLSRGSPPRVAGRDDVSILALGSPLPSPSNPVFGVVADEDRSPMTVAGPRRIHTGFLGRRRLTRSIVARRPGAAVVSSHAHRVPAHPHVCGTAGMP